MVRGSNVGDVPAGFYVEKHNRFDQDLIKERSSRDLFIGKHKERLWLLSNAAVDLVTQHAHDGVRLVSARRFAFQVNLLSNWVLSAKVLARQSFVDDDDERSRGAIVAVNHPSANDRRSHQAVIAAADGGNARIHRVAGILGPANNVKAGAHVDA